MSLTLTTPPASEPISLAEAKVHLRVDHSDSDTEINAMITAARSYIEGAAGIDLAQRTWTYTVDSFPATGGIDLPKHPVISITSIQYVDTNGDTQTLDSSAYVLDNDVIYLAYDESWPTVRDQKAAITIVFVTGTAAIAQAVLSTMLLLIGDLYETRQATPTMTVTQSDTYKMLMRPFSRHPAV